jgi:transposase
MGIVVALDVHRNQITYKALDRETGELSRGRIAPAARAEVRAWLGQFVGCEAEFALEGTTGWRFVIEEIERAGHRAHLADPAETAARRGRKRRAKTDNADCDLQLRLLLAGELPESWIPPAHIIELRTRVRMRKMLIDQRTAWQQRVHAQLFQQGVPAGLRLRTQAGREALRRAELSPAGRELVSLGLRMLDTLDLELAPLDRELRAFARRQPGCRALIERLYGVGPVSATAILAELGDARRFSSSDDAVRHAGLDITVYQSDEKRAPGRLSHEGPEVLRWALFEAAQSAARAGSPDRSYYLQVASGSTTTAPASRSPASFAGAPTTSSASSARRLSPRSSSQPTRRRSQLPPDHPAPARALPVVTKMLCGRLPQTPRRQRSPAWAALRDRAAASNPPRGPHPIDHLVAGPSRSVHPGKAGRPARAEIHYLTTDRRSRRRPSQHP